MSIFLDTCILIYLVESNQEFSDQIGVAMRGAVPTQFCINDLVRLECLVGPMRRRDADLQAAYTTQLAALRVLDMNRAVFDLGASMRAHDSLKTPDALHVATAIQHGCQEFWTGDARLASINDRIRVRVFQRIPG